MPKRTRLKRGSGEVCSIRTSRLTRSKILNRMTQSEKEMFEDVHGKSVEKATLKELHKEWKRIREAWPEVF